MSLIINFTLCINFSYIFLLWFCIYFIIFFLNAIPTLFCFLFVFCYFFYFIPYSFLNPPKITHFKDSHQSIFIKLFTYFICQFSRHLPLDTCFILKAVHIVCHEGLHSLLCHYDIELPAISLTNKNRSLRRRIHFLSTDSDLLLGLVLAPTLILLSINDLRPSTYLHIATLTTVPFMLTSKISFLFFHEKTQKVSSINN